MSLNFTVLVLLMGVTTSLAAEPIILRHVVADDAAVRAADYWTPERRAAAIPLNARALDLSAPEVEQLAAQSQRMFRDSGAPAITETAITETAPETQDFWSPESMATPEATSVEPLAPDFNRYQVPNNLYKGPTRKFPYIAVGRLFMRFNGVNYACSAVVITPGRLVVTSRACLYQKTKGGFADLVNFYPGYQNGLNPNLGGGWIGGVFFVNNPAVVPGERFNIGIVQLRNSKNTGCRVKGGAVQITSYRAPRYVSGRHLHERHHLCSSGLSRHDPACRIYREVHATL